MKVVLIAPASVNHTVKWANGLAKLGHSVTVISQHESCGGFDSDIEVKMLLFRGLKGYWLNAIQLNRLVRKLQPEVVNVHYASGYGNLAMISFISKYILSVWGSDVYEFPYRSKLNHWLINRTLASAKHIASTSYAMASQVQEITGIDTGKISITPFGVNLDKFVNQSSPFSSENITIGLVKKLEHKYGVDILLRAFQHLLNMKEIIDRQVSLSLLIVGGGAEKKSLNLLAKELRLEGKVTFVDTVSNEDVTSYINKMDIFVVPSRIESFGVAAVEALACERPCVVSDVGGLPEVVDYGQVGKVVPQGDVKAFAEAIYSFIDKPEVAVEVGKLGRKHVFKHYTEDNAVNTMNELYNNFVNTNV